MLSPAPRFQHVLQLIDEKKYFTIHAGRQTGNTTGLQWLTDLYNRRASSLIRPWPSEPSWACCAMR